MSNKRLIGIRECHASNTVTFYFDDDSSLTFEIRGGKDTTFLYHSSLCNSEAFHQLGITNPHQLYKNLGIYTNDGDCPECKREDLGKVFDYLLKNYSVSPVKEPNKPKQLTEWDWLLN